MIPKNFDIAVRQITGEDRAFFADALELLNRTQGRDLFNADYLDKQTSSPLSYVVGVFRNEDLVGVGVAEVIQQLDYYRPFLPAIEEEMKGRKVGSFSTLCIDESLQGRGIGQVVSRKRLEWLTSKDCDVILGVSWVSGLPHTSNRVFEKMGFKAVKQVDGFYRESSLEAPFVCPGCDKAPCECGAILYRLNLIR